MKCNIKDLSNKPKTPIEVHELIDSIAAKLKAARDSGFRGDSTALDEFLYSTNGKTKASRSSFLRYLNTPDTAVPARGPTQEAVSPPNPPKDSSEPTSPLLPTPERPLDGPSSWWFDAPPDDPDAPDPKARAREILEEAYNEEKEAGSEGRCPHSRVFWERAELLGRWFTDHYDQLMEINIHYKQRETWSTDHPDGSPAPWGSIGEFRRQTRRLNNWFECLLGWCEETRNGVWFPKIDSSEWTEFVQWMKDQGVQLIPTKWSPPPKIVPNVKWEQEDFQAKLTESLGVFRKEPDEGKRRVKALWDVWNTLQFGAVAELATDELKRMAREDDNPGGWMAKQFLETHNMVEVS